MPVSVSLSYIETRLVHLEHIVYTRYRIKQVVQSIGTEPCALSQAVS